MVLSARMLKGSKSDPERNEENIIIYRNNWFPHDALCSREKAGIYYLEQKSN